MEEAPGLAGMDTGKPPPGSKNKLKRAGNADNAPGPSGSKRPKAPPGPKSVKAKAPTSVPATPSMSEFEAPAGKQSRRSRAHGVGAGGGNKDDKFNEYMDRLALEKVMSGETSRGDLYQAKRFQQSLERKNRDSEAVQLDLKLTMAHSASMLTPGEACKLPLEQLKARGVRGERKGIRYCKKCI